MTNAKGIDVSSYQAETPPLAGLSFLFARASIGTGADSRYTHHIANAKAAGLVTGAYHFGYNGISQDHQADIFMAAAGTVDFYFIDVEGAAAPSQNQTRAFIERVQSTGKRCGLYHSASGFFDAGQDYDWVAKWSPTAPSRHWDFWQYRGSPGDLDQYRGTEAQLRAFAKIPPGPDTGTEDPVVVISNETPMLVDLPVGMQLYDGSGKPFVKVSKAQTQASPFEAEFAPNFHARAITIVTGGQNVLAYVHTSDVTVHPIPVAVDVKHAVVLTVDGKTVYGGNI